MTEARPTDLPGFTPETLNVQPELAQSHEAVAHWPLSTAPDESYSLSAHQGRDAFWLVLRRAGRGGLALRTFPIAGAYDIIAVSVTDTGALWRVTTHSGIYTVRLEVLSPRLIRMTSRLTPDCDLLVAFWPRDLYPLDGNDDPRQVRGRVEAAQRGLNGGYCYFCVETPAFANVFYAQNLSALNPFFRITETKPDGVVGGEWPELGYQPPASPNGFSPPIHPLPAGDEVTISDVLLSWREDCGPGEFASARDFIDMLADIYPHLDKPEVAFRDWPARAAKTAADLKATPDAWEEAYGHAYPRPYLGAEYPDAMTQMTLLASLREYERASGQPLDLCVELVAGMAKFFDDGLQTLRRYLPNVGNDKDPNAVDSWYLYHPLMNLAHLARSGEMWARELFFKSLDFGIRAARHFDYKWPIIYDMRDFSVVKQTRGEEGLGQTDVGGLYAYVMLLAHELSHEAVYIDEARKALRALEGNRFELAYQTNLTAWGALACVKLWRVTGEARYLDQSFVFVAGVLHNCELWSSRIKFADAYANFFGVTCLHDGPYMAAFEGFECFQAFDDYLRVGGDDLPASVRLLLSEFWRHAQNVSWSFFPDALPPDAISKEVRNGRIDPALSFPLEDIYGDGSPAGQIGQEIYGGGAAFILAARAFVDVPGAPYRLHSDYPIEANLDNGSLHIALRGPEARMQCLRILFKSVGESPVKVLLRAENGEHIAPVSEDQHCSTYSLPAGTTVVLMWQPAEETAI